MGQCFFLFLIFKSWFMSSSSKALDYELWLQSTQPRTEHKLLWDKTKQKPILFPFLMKRNTFSTWDSSAYWTVSQSQCGQSLSPSAVESASQLLLWYPFLTFCLNGTCEECYRFLLWILFYCNMLIISLLSLTGGAGNSDSEAHRTPARFKATWRLWK